MATTSMNTMDQIAVSDIHFAMERRKVHSVESFARLGDNDHEAAVAYLAKLYAPVATPEVATLCQPAAARRGTRHAALLHRSGQVQEEAVVVEAQVGQILREIGEVVTQADLQVVTQVA